MSGSYVLTCSCGQTSRVKACQAGTTIRCPCGQSLCVPSLRELATLESAEPERRRRRLVAVWGRHQAQLAVGVVITAAALAGAAALQINMPRLLDVDQLSPIQTWGLWQQLRQGPDRRLSPEQQQYVQRLRDNRFRLQIMFVLAGIGTAVMLAALFVPKQWRRGPSHDSFRSVMPP